MISGFVFPGGNESVLASFLKDLAGPESLSGNLSSTGAVKISHDLEKMQQVKYHSSPSVQTPIGHWYLFYSVQSHFLKNEMLSSDLAHHSGEGTPQVPLFWCETLVLATAARNSLTTWSNKPLERPEILSTGVRQMLRVVPFLPVQWKAQTFAMGGQGGAECCPLSWGLLGHAHSANLKENGSRTANGLVFNHFISPLWDDYSSLFICDLKD